MLGSDLLRDRLAGLARIRRAVDAVPEIPADGAAESELEPTPPGTAPRGPRRRSWWLGEPAPAADAGRLEEFLPGGEWRDERGAVYVHERLRSEMERPELDWGLLQTPPEDEEDLAALVAGGLGRAWFLDLETGGLAASPVFLAGTMHWNGTDFVLRQYFARHYGEEATLIGALHEAARGFETLVTFNGKSYDAPFLLGRAAVHGVKLELPPKHVDLLHPSRRRWKLELPDCKLQTLERHVCRRRRSGDVPSAEVPSLYHDFVRRGDPYRLVPVFHHNLLDVITMGEILKSLCTPRPPRRNWFEELDFA